VQNTPREPPVLYSLPSAATQTWLPSPGSTHTRAMRSVSARPMLRKVLPPSSERNTPSPPYEERDELGSPLPIHRRCGAFGSTAMSPVTMLASRSLKGLKVDPLSVVFHTPPEA